MGFRRSRPAALTSIGYRGFAVAPKPLRASSRNIVVITVTGAAIYETGAQCAPLRGDELLPPLRRSPSLEEGGLGGSTVKACGLAVDWIYGLCGRPYDPSRALTEPFIQPRVQGRNPARFKGGYGVPRGFKGGSKPSAPCGRLSEAEHPKRKGATLLRPLSAVNRNLPLIP